MLYESEHARRTAAPSLTRRSLLGAAVTAGTLPVLAGGLAAAAPAPTTPAAPAAPDVIDPAYEMSPPERMGNVATRRPVTRTRMQKVAPSTTSTSGTMSTFSATGTVPFQFQYEDFDIRALPLEVSPYYQDTAEPLVDPGAHDSTGVRMVLLGTTLYDHPVAQAQYGIKLLESYRITGDTTYLDRAKLQAQRLVDRRVLREGAWFYPYPFRYALHRVYDVYDPPWYSMMAQGQALSLFVRMFKVTGEAAWKEAADATFASFLLPPVVGQPWGVYVVDGHLWLEEYPNPTAIKGDRTYNGHTFSSYGLYDYYQLTGDANAKLLLQGAITTYRDMRDSIRIRHWRSRYCMTHGRDAGYYHTLHMQQWMQLYAITGDPVMVQTGDLWYQDYPPYWVAGSVHFAAGTHTGYKFDAVGKILASKSITLSRASSAPSGDRGKVMNHTGIWYSITAGSLAGYQISEYRGVRYQVGTYAAIPYLLHRPAVIAASSPAAYTIDAAGKMVRYPTTYQIGDAVTVDVHAVLNGVEHVRLAEGDHAGQWLGRAAVTLP